MLVDDINIHLSAGKGGDGAVAFFNIPKHLGPTGADGGNGGSIYFEGVPDIGALMQYQSKRDIKARNGENGKRQFRDGERGGDTVLAVPIGTVITNTSTQDSFEITKIGERMLAVSGGKGGRGNFKFRGSTNTTPMEFEEGDMGESGEFHLSLKLIADVGFIGLPNAGKSSLLNALTAAKAKVANYPFTTLEPNLGVYYDLVLADIPGLIEGAAGGKGLGTKFLKHVERTNSLMHLVSAESDDVVRDYKIIRSELERYSEVLSHKKEYVFISKYDAVDSDTLAYQKKALGKIGVEAEAISIYDDESLESVKIILNAIAGEKHV